MTVLTETRERFLRMIAAQVPPERIAEIHFFQPIKQGGVESGVAVVAAYQEVATPAAEQMIESAPDEASVDLAAIAIDDVTDVSESIEGDTAEESAAESASEPGEDADAATIVDSPVGAGAEAIAEVDVDAPIEATNEATNEASEESASEGVQTSSEDEQTSSEDEQTPPAEAPAISEESSELVVEPTRVPAEARHTIYTARYRLTLKGLDRGKWEANVVAEADAPLVTVDAVVRGVQRRSGDADDATRLDGAEVRALLAPRIAVAPSTKGAA
jgi:hypothetical protein